MGRYYNQAVKEVLAELRVDSQRGLNNSEVSRRRAEYGPNTLQVRETPLWRKLLEPFIDIFMIILLVALILSLFQGDWIEAIAIGVIVVADVVVYYIQKFSTERKIGRASCRERV